ncbi:MAG TPA: ribosomal protein S18-alanine N-acetyltransferase [Candidatus Polarisedimenticolia bacterium]|nr:ribosomal protein S18-alanine N-acetyltransferase [Candidatus Polarisedimenticolia bacterium]
MREADLREVAAVERASFRSPWPQSSFREELRSASYARCVTARGPRPARGLGGYICYWILGPELLINNLAVAAPHRRRGVGRLLLRHALHQGRAEGCLAAFLEVRPSNQPAIHLYETHGFQVVGRRRAYYTDTGEDALVMRAILESS